jgi:hypothetical protein
MRLRLKTGSGAKIRVKRDDTWSRDSSSQPGAVERV